MQRSPRSSRFAAGPLLLALLAVTAAPGAGVGAAVVTTSPAAQAQLPISAAITDALAGGDFAAIAWIHPEDTAMMARTLVDLGGALQIDVSATGRIEATLHDDQGGSLTASPTQPLAAEAWGLVGVSFEDAAGRLRVWVRAPAGIDTAETVQMGFQPRAAAGDVTLGARGGIHALEGAYGAFALRSHALVTADLETLWTDRHTFGAYDTDTTGAGGMLDGPAGCRWMVFHAIASNATNGSEAELLPPVFSSYAGRQVTTQNLIVYDTAAAIFPDVLSVARPITSATDLVHAGLFDAPLDGFFVRQPWSPNDPLPPVPYVPAESPRLRQLATAPVEQLRIMASANSRATLPNDGSNLSPGNYCHGFIDLNESDTAGVMFRPATLEVSPWFAMDCAENQAYADGGVVQTGPTTFSRFWSGSFTAATVGPGPGVLLPQGGQYIMRAAPAGLMEATEPLTFRAYVLAYPGATDLEWAPNKSTQQGDLGTDVGPASIVPLDTETFAYVMTAADSATTTQITADGDLSGDVSAGDAIQTAGQLSLVESVAYDGPVAGMTVISLASPIPVPPAEGDTLRFGPWAHVVIEHPWPGLAGTDPMTWRGLRLRAIPGSGQGAVVFAFDAWRPGVDGFVFGACGWSGNGYVPQLEESFPEVIRSWMSLSATDVWLVMFATQFNTPDAMSIYTAVIRDALPDAEIGWFGGARHRIATWEPWHRYILENAAGEGVFAASAIRDPRLGQFTDQLAEGLRADANHLSAKGNLRLAEIWTEQLLLAALDCLIFADINRDGTVDSADLSAVVGGFGTEPGPFTGGDINGDGKVDGADLSVLIGAFGQSCPP